MSENSGIQETRSTENRSSEHVSLAKQNLTPREAWDKCHVIWKELVEIGDLPQSAYDKLKANAGVE